MPRFCRLIIQHPKIAWATTGMLIILLSIPPILGLSGTAWIDPPDERWASEADRSELSEVYEFFDTRVAEVPMMLVLDCDDFFQPARVAAVRRAMQHVAEIDGVGQVIWVDTIPVGGLSLFESRSLWPADDASPQDLESSREALVQHPVIGGQFVSKDGRTLLAGVVAWGDPIIEQIREVTRKELDPVDVRLRVTGPNPLWRAHRNAFDEDHGRILAIACGLVVFLALIIFRGLPAIIVACSGPALGVLWAEGWLELLGHANNDLAEVIVPVMILMIGFTDSVHVVVHVRQQRARGDSAVEAAASSISHVGLACLLTSVTTAIGFLSLLVADAEVIHGFGRAAAIGVVVSFIAVMLVVPLLSCSWIGRRIDRGYERDLVARNMTRLSVVIDWLVRHSRLVVAGGIVLTAVLATGTLLLEPDDRLAHRIPEHTEAWQAMDHCDRELGGIRFMLLVIQWPEGTSREDIWQVLGMCEELLEKEPLISSPVSIRDVMTQVPGLHGPLKLGMTGLIPDEIRYQFWHPDAHRTQVMARMQDLGSARYAPVWERIEASLREIESDRPGFRLFLSGDAVVEGRTMRRIVGEVFHSLLLASVIIFVVITASFRSIRFGLLSVIPNVFPLATTAMLRACIDTSLDVSSAFSFAVCLGIAVDDTIHFLTRYRHERAAGHDVPTAIRGTFITVGSALVMTTVVMISGFASVMTSQLPTHFLFASMACTTIAAALLGDLILLPALLARFPEPDAELSSE